MAERDWAVPAGFQVGEPLDLLVAGDVPFRQVEIPKAQIEAFDIGAVEELFRKALLELRANGFVAAWSVMISGYEKDPRELCVIPEVRAWCRKAHKHYPAFTYLLLPGSINWYLFSLLELTQAGERDSSGWTPFILESLDLLDTLSGEISEEVLAFLIEGHVPEDKLLSVITEFSLRLSAAFPRRDNTGE
jgi:hypothetical protein